MSSLLFSPLALRGLTLANRIAVSPMCTYSAEAGRATDWHLMHLGQFAVSGAGLVIAEATAVEARGRISPGCLGLYDDSQVPALARVVDFCKGAGAAAFGLQLAHAGRKASTAAPWRGGAPLAAADGGWPVVGPSAVPYDDRSPVPEALDESGLAQVRDAFAAAARRADAAGVDLIEIHGAHGYLLHSFLSPLSNRRADSYGGGRDNRMRFPLEVAAAVRAAWPADKPLGMRVTATDWVADAESWDIEDTVAFAKALAGIGIDYIDVSTGGASPRQKLSVAPGFQTPFAARVRAETGLPTMTVGLIFPPRQAEALLEDGTADLIALGRGMLYDPRWPWHAARELGEDIAYPPQYRWATPKRWLDLFGPEAG